MFFSVTLPLVISPHCIEFASPLGVDLHALLGVNLEALKRSDTLCVSSRLQITSEGA